MSHSRNFVHHLVKTLTPLEKAYIKRQIKNNEVHLLQLLEDLYKTEVCNNKHFIKKYKTRNYTKNLTQNKNYLRQKIINALVQYGIKHSTEIEKRNLLNIITVLIEKGFLKKAKELLDDILVFAKKYEDYTTCYDLSIIIRKIYSSNISYSLSYKEIYKYAEDRRFYLKQLNRFETLARLNDIHLSSIDEREKIDSITSYLKKIKLFKLEALPKDYPYNAKRIFYFTKFELARLKKDVKTSNLYIRKNFELLQYYPHFIEKDISSYLVDSINFLNSFLSDGDYDSFFEEHQKIINQIEQLKQIVHSRDSYRLHILQYLFPQNAYNNCKKFNNALLFAIKYQQFIKNNKKDLSEHFIATSVSQIAIAYLYNQQFEKALDVIEPYAKTKIYTHQYTFRLLQILAHYFLKNDMLMPYLFNSFTHYLKTVEKKTQTKGILNLKKAIAKQSLKTMQNDVFENFFYLRWDVLNNINTSVYKKQGL